MKIVQTERAPSAIGPYSQGMIAGDFLFTAGQIGIDPQTKEMAPGGIREQTEQSLKNIRAIVESAGGRMDSVVKTTIYLTRPEDFPVVNEIYSRHFSAPFPARTTVFVNSLPKGALVEIEAIAKIG